MEIEKEQDDNSMDEEEDVDKNKCKRQLDVTELVRTYNKMNCIDNDGYFKDVLCMAISSLCG